MKIGMEHLIVCLARAYINEGINKELDIRNITSNGTGFSIGYEGDGMSKKDDVNLCVNIKAWLEYIDPPKDKEEEVMRETLIRSHSTFSVINFRMKFQHYY